MYRSGKGAFERLCEMQVAELTIVASPVGLARYIKKFRLLQQKQRSLYRRCVIGRAPRSMSETNHERTFTVVDIGAPAPELRLRWLQKMAWSQMKCGNMFGRVLRKKFVLLYGSVLLGAYLWRRHGITYSCQPESATTRLSITRLKYCRWYTHPIKTFSWDGCIIQKVVLPEFESTTRWTNLLEWPRHTTKTDGFSIRSHVIRNIGETKRATAKMVALIVWLVMTADICFTITNLRRF